MPRPKKNAPPATQRNSASVMLDGVLVKGCTVAVRLIGRDEPLIGQVTRSMCPIARTCALWPYGWDDAVVLAIREIETAVIADMTREELRAVRAKQRGGQR